MEPTDLTIEILKSIRDELRGLREGQGETNARLDQTNTRLESLERTTNDRFEALERGQDRHERALGLLIEAVQGLGGRIENIVAGPLGEKVRDLDRRVTALEARCEP